VLPAAVQVRFMVVIVLSAAVLLKGSVHLVVVQERNQSFYILALLGKDNILFDLIIKFSLYGTLVLAFKYPGSFSVKYQFGN